MTEEVNKKHKIVMTDEELRHIWFFYYKAYYGQSIFNDKPTPEEKEKLKKTLKKISYHLKCKWKPSGHVIDYGKER